MIDVSFRSFKIVKCSNCGLLRTLRARVGSKKVMMARKQKSRTSSQSRHQSKCVKLLKEQQGADYYLVEDRVRVERMDMLIKEEPAGKLLDLGCAEGFYSSRLIRFGWDCYGVDISEAYKNALEKGVKAVKHDLEESIPFDDSFFDLVVAGEIIEHLIDTDHFLEECRRVLKVKGFLILSTPNIVSLSNRCLVLLGRYPALVQYRAGLPTHVRYYNANVLKYQLSEHGFETQKLVGTRVSVPLIFRSRFLRERFQNWLGLHFPTLSEVLIVKARRTR